MHTNVPAERASDRGSTMADNENLCAAAEPLGPNAQRLAVRAGAFLVSYHRWYGTKGGSRPIIVDSDARASPSQRNAILPAARALRVAFNLKVLNSSKKQTLQNGVCPLGASGQPQFQRERPPKLPEATPMNAPRRRRSGRAAGSATEAAWGSPPYAISCDATAIRF